MSDITFTMHAETRIQQRGIPPMVIDLLMQFGSASRCGGAERLMFDKLALRRLRRHLGGDRGLKLIDRWLNVYAIIGDNGQLVTVAHKHSHFYR
jgi:hypothetical protein